jgi:splicing factor 3B subunit 3
MNETVLFNPRKLANIQQTDEINSLGCVTDFVVDNSDKDSVQILTISGRSSRSSLRILKHGINVIDQQQNGGTVIPGNPIAVWTIKSDINDPYDRFIIIAFQQSTTVLSIETGEAGKFLPLNNSH